MAVLVVDSLTKSFPGAGGWFSKPTRPFVAVDGISFELGEGEILGLLGANGAGKTTTIQMLLSTLTPTSGSIKYFGKELAQHRSEILQHVTFASTYVKLPGRLTAWENLDVFGRLYGIPHNTRIERINKYLKLFGLDHLRDKEAVVMSAGEATRLMLAKAFIAHPRVVLLDEPTASLDPDVAQAVRQFVLEQKNEFGVSVLFTSHNMTEVTEVCDRVLVMRNGKIIANNTPWELAATVSTSRVNLLIADGLKRTIQYVEELGLSYSLQERSIDVEMNERKVAEFLMGLAKIGVVYSQIYIQTPSLEDYFLSVVKPRDERGSYGA